MATSAPPKQQQVGIIILGNAGAGKSFLCNLLIGGERFKTAFSPRSVTTRTEFHRINGDNGKQLLVYNIPGLIESNQERINENKREIKKAFKDCPYSIVLFVWGNNGGRIQNDDVITFKALYAAYQFPESSLAFVVNNLPANRPVEYDAAFVVALEDALTPQKYPIEEFIFVEQIDPQSADAKQKFERPRLLLLQLIDEHQPAPQVQHQDIQLDLGQLDELRKILQEQMEAAKIDQEALLARIAATTKSIEALREANKRQIHKLKKRLKKKDAKIEWLTDKLEKTQREHEESEKNRQREERTHQPAQTTEAVTTRTKQRPFIFDVVDYTIPLFMK
ncbi:unnamed protein product [Rotaria magnacalcarata]|uniref:AIG1-type G domain-containing protein n=1 Tax=Rotaria magnacalcarata TaxID=392030 RepID=A0A816NQN3_9BILA|nr:unnamed protein product [Rotaria magnacalcarata]CAF2038435.1 unnamed protein product [Rotaria magnacalcarata]CAF2049266.1 unnamed protein product [Rotaria magnacalcarata]CAF3998967.1 unnamed protein product [Rotaria magnacalcarata]CAF4163261.1 unnamed protein product [Rotaria magnacalcarata]